MQKAGWFSSLRRQPKSHNKGGSKNLSADKPLQKSCVDLTGNNEPDIEKANQLALFLKNGGQITCRECHRYYVPGVYEKGKSLNEVVQNAINSSKIGTKYSQTGSATVTKAVLVNRTEELLRPAPGDDENLTQFTERITVTRTTVIKKPAKRIEFFPLNDGQRSSPGQSELIETGGGKSMGHLSNRNGLVFDDDGRILGNSLNFDFEFIDEDRQSTKSPTLPSSTNSDATPTTPSHPGLMGTSIGSNSPVDTALIKLNRVAVPRVPPLFLVNSYTLGQTTNICDNCLNKRLKSRSDWNISSSQQIKDELFEVVSEMEGLESQEESKSNNKDKQMSIGRKKFNMDPKKGIEYLRENHLIRMDPADVANFLYKGEGLNKTAIGDYLGEKNDFNEQVLKAFVELHDFTNLILVQALRQFLWSFRLPGEAQKIDRMMECFAQRYCQLNPDIFTNTDTCYVLSFAIIMLNTSLHNPSVKDKPTVEQFISMNRGINNGGDLPRELLESLYDSIRTEPFKIPQDDGNDLMHTFFNPDKEGWLWKQGGRYKSWKRRWFILNDNCLYYFEYTTDKEPRGIIPLENISVREITDRNKPHCFELFASGGADIIKACKTDSEGKVVEGKHTVYRMSAATEEDKQEWIKCLAQSISHNPFYDILVQRKKKALAKS